MAEIDPIQLNVSAVDSLVSSGVNKIDQSPAQEQQVSEDEFKLDMSDDELLNLSSQWVSRYNEYESSINKRQELNKKFYSGRQKEGTGVVATTPIASNILFEAEETFLPVALSQNPTPVVYSDNTPAGNKASKDIQTMLAYHADILVLRRKLTMMTRHWSIYFIGVLKHGWDNELHEIRTEVRNPKNFIFDPEGYVDVYGDIDTPIGERITCQASELIARFPTHKDFIKEQVENRMGTKVTYIEWWTDDYCFFTYKKKVLDKYKNPNFNYPKQDGIDNILEEGRNHFARPKKPYTFLSVFSLGQQPHDITGLIEQNIPNQNLITRRTEQIDANLSRANNSIAYSEENFTQQTAKQASTAMEKGHPIIVPAGKPMNEAIMRFDAPSFPPAAFEELNNNIQHLRTIFGTEGLTPTKQNTDITARGQILNQQYDNSRIGGGIGDAIEQVADNVFNWWTQLYYVFYDEQHEASIIGKAQAVEYSMITSTNLDRKFTISVAPNSMQPKDELTKMNQAISLWEAKALDPKTLLTILNIPDVQKTAESTVLWLVDPQKYIEMNFPELVQQMQQGQQGQPQGQPQGQQSQPQAQVQPQQGAQPPTLGGENASSALSQVQLPPIPK